MHPKFPSLHLAGVLLLAAAPFAEAQSPLPDPVAPAVIGRPLDQIRPSRPARAKPAAAPRRAPAARPGGVLAAPERPKQLASSTPPRPTARMGAGPAATQAAPAPQQVAKQAPAERVAAAALPTATRLVAMPPRPGAYFSGRDQALVRQFYEAHPASGRVANWKAGEPVPPRAELAGVPGALRAALPVLPPGHQYVQLDGEVVLVAVQTRTVVDGVARSVR